MTTLISGKDWRNKLFKKTRPQVRKYDPKDNGYLWAAYQNGSFILPEGMSQEQFLVAMAEQFGAFNLLWVIEDDNHNYKAKRGLIGIVGIKTDGWAYEPSIHFFQWATAKNKLRSLVGFFQMCRYQKDIGVCRLEAKESEAKDMLRLRKYGVLYPRGRIPKGHKDGDLLMFSISGQR